LLQATAALGISLALLAGTAHADKTGKPAEGATCGEYGTSVKFYSSPSAAATRAKKDEKLVMVLHVSGNFENPDFT
jgi:hypothetical protein